jgi:hypothetical protein
MATFVLNPEHSGFNLSEDALERLGWDPDDRFLPLEKDARSNPELVRVCEELGAAASAYNTPFSFVRVPKDALPYVRLREYDGLESLYIDKQAKMLGTEVERLAGIHDAIRAVMTTHKSDAEKLSDIATLLESQERC